MSTNADDPLARWGIPLLLGLLVLFSPRPWDVEETMEVRPLSLPWRIGDRIGLEVALDDHVQTVLEGSQWLSRGYWKTAPDEPDIIWVNMTQAVDIARLHNYYDSLVASGAQPMMMGEVDIPLNGHTIRASHIRYRTASGPAHMLFWYQAGADTASNRWAWYGKIIHQRLQGKNPPWRLVEVASSADGNQNGDGHADLKRLGDFVRSMQTSAPHGTHPPE